jgi:hypothetical protein
VSHFTVQAPRHSLRRGNLGKSKAGERRNDKEGKVKQVREEMITKERKEEQENGEENSRTDREMPCSILGRHSNCSDWDFSCFR